MKRAVFLVTSLFALFTVNVSADNSNKYVVSNQNVTFFEGYRRCLENGLDPGEITSEEDEKEVEKVLQSHPEVYRKNGFWIFATNLGDKVSYYWLHSGKPLLYSAFAPGEPNNADNSENCLEIFQITTGNFAWNDFSCDKKLRFICQYKDK